jgi:hypothetical protein
VPVYTGPQERLTALPNVRVAAAQSDLPQFGASLQRAGADLGAIAAREQERQNADRLFRAEAALKEEYLAFETSLRERRGQNAWGVTGDVRQWWEENGKRHTEGLENDAQRALFEPQVSTLRQQSMESAAKYEAQERRVSLEESARSSIVNSINVAAASHDNPDAIAGAKSDVLKRIQVQAEFNGWTPERREAEESLHLTNLHKQVLQPMVDADPERAREYFAANKSEIAGADQDELEKLVRVGGLRAKAQRETDALLTRGETEAETLKRAREQFEGEERDEVVARVEKRFREQRATDEQGARTVANAAWDIFGRTNSVDSIPTPLLEQLDGRTLHALRQAERADALQTDWEVYTDLRQEAFAQPEAFVARDIRQSYPDLHPTQRRELLNLQEKLQTPEQHKDVATLSQQLGAAARMLELEPEERGQFESRAQQALDREQTVLGRELTFDDRQKVIDRMLIQGEVIGGGFFGLIDSDRRLFEVAPDDVARFEFDVSEVPAADRQQIEAALEKIGQPATDAAIVELYRLGNLQ